MRKLILLVSLIGLSACTGAYEGRKTNCWSAAPVAAFAETGAGTDTVTQGCGHWTPVGGGS